MAVFRTGTLAPPVRVHKAAPRLVLDAQLAWAGPFLHVYAKVLPINERSIEAVCAWLAREVELPAPEACFLRMHRTRVPKGHPWIFGDSSEEVVFATVAVEQAQQLVRADGTAVAALIDKWPSLAAAAVFDELIANDDRTEGNILLGPRSDLWLIDHTRALGGAGNRLFSTEVAPLFTNFFLQRIAGYSLAQRNGLRAPLMAACLRLTAAVPRVPYDELLVPENVARQIETFLRQRANRLQTMILSSIGLPDLYDGGNASRVAQ